MTVHGTLQMLALLGDRDSDHPCHARRDPVLLDARFHGNDRGTKAWYSRLLSRVPIIVRTSRLSRD